MYTILSTMRFARNSLQSSPSLTTMFNNVVQDMIDTGFHFKQY